MLKYPETSPPTIRVLITSFTVNILDVVLNGVITFLTGSVVMFSELLQGVADLVASAFLVVGYQKSRQLPDKKHPFGYGRELYFWTLMSTLTMLTLTAGFSIFFGIQRFLNPYPLGSLYFAYGVLIISVVSNGYSLTLSFQKLMAGESRHRFIRHFLESPLIETKVTFISDLMGTLAAFLGLLTLGLYRVTGEMRLDGLGAIIIGVCVGMLAYFLLLGVKDLLIGKTASVETEEKIRDIALGVRGVTEIVDLRTGIIGSEKILVNLAIHIDHALQTQEIEKLMDSVRHELKHALPSIHHLQIEIETPKGES